MCDIGNLIDLTGWDEPVKDETVVEETPTETVPVESKNYKGPYDPFDSMEKEACIKGLHLKKNMENLPTTAAINLHNEDQDLNNETPPVAIESQTPTNAIKHSAAGNDPRQLSLQHLAKLNAARLSSINQSTPPPNNAATKCSKNTIGNYFESSFLSENLQMLAAESPVKLIEDEPNPIPITSPTTNLSDEACSNSEFAARLKMLRIAILDSPAKTTLPEVSNSVQNPTATNVNSPQTLPTSGQPDVGKLLQDMKYLISEHVDISKRDQFNMLLESLSTAFLSCSAPTTPDTNRVVQESPHKYTRQATFDLDLDVQKRKVEATDNTNVQPLPDLMTCSSATFDGESLDKPTSPIIQTEILGKKSDSYVTEVVNEHFALQINELLERHNLTRLQMNDNEQHHYESEHTDIKSGGSSTVILVVNSTGTNQLSNCIVHPSAARTVITPAISNENSSLRRRSSSLSIHDKSKQDRPRALVKQYSGDNQYVPLKELSNVGDKLNVMPSFRQRRNSFSVGTTAGKVATPAAHGKVLMGSRVKPAAINESVIKSASTKANVPIKRVVPMVKTSLAPSELTYLNTTTPRCNVQDTPMAAKGKAGGKMFCTSTPMPQMRTLQRRSLRPVSNYSSSCSSTSSVRPASLSKKAAQ